MLVRMQPFLSFKVSTTQKGREKLEIKLKDNRFVCCFWEPTISTCNFNALHVGDKLYITSFSYEMNLRK